MHSRIPPRTAGRGVVLALAASLGVLLAAPLPARAQESHEDETRAPGWTLIPVFRLAGVWDDNVSLFGEGSTLTGDYATSYQPRIDLHHLGRHGTFSLGYQGTFQTYRRLDELNRYSQRGRIEFRQRILRHTEINGRESFTAVPTTDQLDVGGIPFRRTGGKQNDVQGGVRQHLSAHTWIEGTYRHQWVGFDRDPLAPAALRGGHAHEVLANVRHQPAERLSVGGGYSFRRARVSGGVEPFDVHTAEAAFDYRAAEAWTLSGAFGLTSLQPESLGERQVDPSWRAGVTGKPGRAVVGAGYARAYLPSFGSGGTSRTDELSASLRVPLVGVDRLSLLGRLRWRRDVPVSDIDRQLHLRSLWIDTTLSYALQPWLRLEGFVARVHQDTLLAGGRLTRHRLGFQVVTSKPIRIR